MLYFLIRPLARLAILIFYRKVYFTNRDRIPAGKPVIMAVNHPTGFVEPCILAVFTREPLHYLVRGDLFRKPLFNFLLRSLRMVPIYRRRDAGYEGLKNNYDTFQACFDTLQRRRRLVIFPEGTTKHEKRLRPIQKGIGRIAFGTLQHYPELDDLLVVPIGVNYTYATLSRSEVMIDVGEPFGVRDLLAAGNEHPNRATRLLQERLDRDLRERLVIIENIADEELTEYLLRLDRSERQVRRFPVLELRYNPLPREQAVARQVTVMASTKKQQLQQYCQEYFEFLRKSGISDQEVYKDTRGTVAELPVLLLLSLLSLPGYLFAVLPYAYAKKIRDERVKRVEFLAPVLIGTQLGVFLLLYLLLLLISLLLWSLWPLVLGILLGGLAVIQLECREAWASWQRRRRWETLDHNMREHIQLQRRGILQLWKNNTR